MFKAPSREFSIIEDSEEAIGFSREIICKFKINSNPYWFDNSICIDIDEWRLSSVFSELYTVMNGVSCRCGYTARLKVIGHFGRVIPAKIFLSLNYSKDEQVDLLRAIYSLHFVNHLFLHGSESMLRINLDKFIDVESVECMAELSQINVDAAGLTGDKIFHIFYPHGEDGKIKPEVLATIRKSFSMVGLGGFFEGNADLIRLWAMEPDVFFLSARALRNTIIYPSVREKLSNIVAQISLQGFNLGVDGIDCGRSLGMASQLGAKYISGRFLVERCSM